MTNNAIKYSLKQICWVSLDGVFRASLRLEWPSTEDWLTDSGSKLELCALERSTGDYQRK